jgi:hypothetical protein
VTAASGARFAPADASLGPRFTAPDAVLSRGFTALARNGRPPLPQSYAGGMRRNPNSS